MFIVSTFCLLAYHPRVYSYTDVEDTRKSLKGVESVSVEIWFSEKLKGSGLTEDQLRTDVELKLRLAKIKVLSDDGFGTYRLIVNLNGYKFQDKPHPQNFIVFDIEVAFVQFVSPASFFTRNIDDLVMACTWETGYLGTCGTRNLDPIRNIIKDMIDQFINVYLQANQK